MPSSSSGNASRRDFFQAAAAICCPEMDSSDAEATLEENGIMYGLISKIISAPNQKT